MPLSRKQKKSVLKKIRKTSEESIYEPLLELIKQGVNLPIIGNTSPLKEYFIAYEASKSRKKYAQLQLEIIKEHLKEYGCREFMEALTLDTTDAEQFSDTFIEHFSTHFNWPLTVEPSVELTIVAGKVYWKIVQGDDILYDNADVKGHDSSQFFAKDKAIITMSWSNFRRFKDAGKRTSSAEITKERFHDECSELSDDVTKTIPKKYLQRKSVVTQIWEELKKRGLIDNNNNRLTHAWYSYSGSLLLNCVNDIADKFTSQQDKKETSFLHTYIAQALNNASINPDYRKALPASLEIFRPARTLRVWKSTGKLSFPSSVEYPVQQLDVGSYLELKKHEKSGDGLEHDHIPSQCCIKKDIQNQYQNGDLDASEFNKEKKRSDDWGSIEVTEAMHKNGKTHFKSAAVQRSMGQPFYLELDYYINEAIKEDSSPQYIIEVIGAFRYLFSCHIKEKFMTDYSHGFFYNKPDLINDIDTLLLEKLSQASVNL